MFPPKASIFFFFNNNVHFGNYIHILVSMNHFYYYLCIYFMRFRNHSCSEQCFVDNYKTSLCCHDNKMESLYITLHRQGC